MCVNPATTAEQSQLRASPPDFCQSSCEHHISPTAVFLSQRYERERENTLKMYSISRPKGPPTSCPLVFGSQVTGEGADFDDMIQYQFI